MSEHESDGRMAFAKQMAARGVSLGADPPLSHAERDRLVEQADALPPVGGPLDDLLLAAGPDRVVLVDGSGQLILRAADLGRGRAS